MTHSFDILLVSRRKELLERLQAVLQSAGLAARTQLNSNGHVDPLYGVERMPDAVVLHLSHLWREELEALIARRPERRPALIVVGTAIDMNAMRLAMQAGARDLLPDPVSKADLLEAIRRAQEERRGPVTPAQQGTVSVFMNAKGGCGATMLACNVAHVFAAESKKRTALIDLDLQFGAAPLYLDLYPKRGIAQALDNLAGLDEVALEGYFTRHACGLDVLSRGIDEPLAPQAISAAAIGQLLDITLRHHESVVIDMPRWVDAVSTATLHRANHVVVVLQQSVTALRDASRLMQWLRADAGVEKGQLTIVVNRHEKAASISAADIQRTLACDEPVLIPNDFRCVSECIDSGTALLDYARSASITRAVKELETRLGGTSAHARSSLIARTFSNLIPGRS